MVASYKTNLRTETEGQAVMSPDAEGVKTATGYGIGCTLDDLGIVLRHFIAEALADRP